MNGINALRKEVGQNSVVPETYEDSGGMSTRRGSSSSCGGILISLRLATSETLVNISLWLINYSVSFFAVADQEVKKGTPRITGPGSLFKHTTLFILWTK